MANNNTQNTQFDITVEQLVSLEKIDNDVFRSRYNRANVYDSIFGGQIVAQALAAADLTVKNRAAHSLHSYFLRPGAPDIMTEFHVERIRDGKRFSTRSVTARQGDKTIFIMNCSYKIALDGFEHQTPAKFDFDPEKAIDFADLARSGRNNLSPFIQQFSMPQPFEVRIPQEEGFLKTNSEAKRHYWLKLRNCNRISNPATNRQLLTLMSDYLLPGVSLTPHCVPLPSANLFVASIDHSVWFHRDIQCSDWLLFETDSPSACQSVNIARGLVYNRAGDLAATITQESLQIRN